MAWIEAHQGLANHVKTIKLRKILKIKKIEAIGILFLLWWWALDCAPSGDLSGLDDDDISEIVEYKAKGNTTVLSALIEAGFIDENKHIHDWGDYAGKLIEKRKTDAERKRTVRGRTYNKDRKSNGSPSDVQRTDDGRPTEVEGTQHNTTQHNTTVPKEKKNTPSCVEESFNRFWGIYPKKVDKQDALKVWQKLKPDEELILAILTAVNNQSAAEQWIKENGQYIPSPASWLRKGKWTDEVKTAASKYRLEVY